MGGGEFSIHPPLRTADDIVAAAFDADVLCMRDQFGRVTAEVLARLPRLKLVVTRSVGYDHIDLAEAKWRGGPYPRHHAGKHRRLSAGCLDQSAGIADGMPVLHVACSSHSRVSIAGLLVLIGAMNPCPCGDYGDAVQECTCSHSMVSRYQKRISSPLLDRLDTRSASRCPAGRGRL